MFSSLLHKDIRVVLAGFEIRARYWIVGTVDPGSGESPAVEPFRQALIDVLKKHSNSAPGRADDNFHVQVPGTHAACMDRLSTTDEYQLITCAEGGPMLCPSWPNSSSWNQSTHINVQRYLDGAY